MKIVNCCCLLLSLLMILSCGGPYTQNPFMTEDPSARLIDCIMKLQQGKLLKIHTMDAHVVIGKYHEWKNDTLYLVTNLVDTCVAANDIFEVWERGRGTKKGMVKGAEILGVAGAVLVNIVDAIVGVGDDSNDSGDGYGRTMGLTLAGATVGAACGALIGSGAGSLSGAWYRKFRRSHSM